MFKVRYVSGSTAFFTFLPPANKVWRKVMFSHVSVILSTGGRGLPCGESASEGSASTEVCLHWSLHPGESAYGGLPAGGSKLEKRTACILLECLLVKHFFLFNFASKCWY